MFYLVSKSICSPISMASLPPASSHLQGKMPSSSHLQGKKPSLYAAYNAKRRARIRLDAASAFCRKTYNVSYRHKCCPCCKWQHYPQLFCCDIGAVTATKGLRCCCSYCYLAAAYRRAEVPIFAMLLLTLLSLPGLFRKALAETCKSTQQHGHCGCDMQMTHARKAWNAPCTRLCPKGR
jgi:hypothetical protein